MSVPEVYRFDHLRRMAIKSQQSLQTSLQRINESSGDEADKQKSRAGLERAIQDARNVTEATIDITRYLLYVGIDLKGQLQTAYTASGWGGTVEASVNPFGLVGLNTEVAASGSLKSSKMRALVVSRGPNSIPVDGVSRGVPQPILVNSMIGRYWEAKAQLSIDVSVGWSVEAGVTPKQGDAQAKASASNGFVDTMKKDDEPPTTGFEAVGCAAEAKIGFEASAGYTYDHFYAEDLYPLSYSDAREAKSALDVILQEGSSKTMFKKDAIDFINQNHVHFGGPLQLHRKVLWHTTTKGHKDIIKRLDAGLENAPRDVRRHAWVHLERLRTFTEAGDGSVFLRLSSHKPEGRAGVYAAGSASASAGGLANVGVDAKAFAGVSGSYKRAYARFQTRCLCEPSSAQVRAEPPPIIYTTYDSVISYKSFFLGLELDFDVTADVVGKGVSLKDDTGLGDGLDAINEKVQWRPDHLNQMTYTTAIAYWRRPAPLGRDTRAGTVVEATTDSLQGTGVCFGQTFTVTSLRRIYTEYWNGVAGSFAPEVRDSKMLLVIAAALHCTVPQVLEFLSDAEVYVHISFMYPDPSVGVILESGHRTTSRQCLGINRSIDKKTGRDLVQLQPKFGQQLIDSGLELESIRLRHRKRDVDDSDSTLFTCGFKALGTGFKIKLEKVERAGADGIADVCTVFLGAGLKATAAGGVRGQAEAYSQAVPPAALFCQ